MGTKISNRISRTLFLSFSMSLTCSLALSLQPSLGFAQEKSHARFYDGAMTVTSPAKNPKKLTFTCSFPKVRQHPKGLKAKLTIDAPEGFFFDQATHYSNRGPHLITTSLRSQENQESSSQDYICAYKNGKAVIETIEGWAPEHPGILVEPVAAEADKPCDPTTTTAKVSDQSGELSDQFTILKAAAQILGPNETSLRVREMPGQVVICDTENDGVDCKAREVVLSNGKRKLLMVLQRPQGELFKAGEAVLIDKSNLVYVDRTKERECAIPEFIEIKTSSGLTLTNTGDNRGNYLKLWTLRRANDDQESQFAIAQEDTKIVAALYGIRANVIPKNLAIDARQLVCATSSVLRLGPKPKAIDIPVVPGF